jgi:hypothetical protein
MRTPATSGNSDLREKILFVICQPYSVHWTEVGVGFD